MAIAALAHRFVFSASPYVASLNYFSQRKLSISPSSDMHKPFLEIDQVQECVTGSCSRVADADVKASSTSLKDSVQDVVLGGGETVRLLLLCNIYLSYNATGFFPFLKESFIISDFIPIIILLVNVSFK
jgi:hypothetical protein